MKDFPTFRKQLDGQISLFHSVCDRARDVTPCLPVGQCSQRVATTGEVCFANKGSIAWPFNLVSVPNCSPNHSCIGMCGEKLRCAFEKISVHGRRVVIT